MSIIPEVIQHIQDNKNTYEQNGDQLVCERVVLKLLLEEDGCLNEDERLEQTASIMDTFWNEWNDFQHCNGVFVEKHTWVTTQSTQSYTSHMKYSLPYTKAWGKVICWTP